MATVKDIESTMARWYRNVPHLPKGGREWLADNVWWLALIGAIVSVIGLFGAIPLLFALLTFDSVVNGVSIYANVNPAGRGLFTLNLFVTVIVYIVTTVILVLSVNPLRAKARRGWELLFWSLLIEFAIGAVVAIVSLAVSSLISDILAALIGGYLLFEIRDYFGTAHRTAKEARVVKAKKK